MLLSEWKTLTLTWQVAFRYTPRLRRQRLQLNHAF